MMLSRPINRMALENIVPAGDINIGDVLTFVGQDNIMAVLRH